MKLDIPFNEQRSEATHGRSIKKSAPHSNFEAEPAKDKSKSILQFFLGIFCGFILNFVALLFVFCIQSKHFMQGYFVGFIYFVFFALLVGLTYFIYQSSKIAE